MCVTEIFIDSYPDGGEVEFLQTRLCQYGYPGDPCEVHSMMENPIRHIQYGEPTSEFILSQLRTPPRSSGSSQRPASMVEVIDERAPLPARKKKRPLTGLFMEAFFGDTTRSRQRSRSRSRSRRQRSRSRSRSRERVVVTNAPLPTRRPRTRPPPIIPPMYRAPGPRVPGLSSPMSPRYEDRESPFIIEASPTRDRQRPIVHDPPRRPRSRSVEVRFATSRQERPRSPSPPSYEERQRQQRLEEDRERRRRRNQREERLAAEIDLEREQRRREEFRMLHDAEINARPAHPRVPPATQPLRTRPRPILRPVVEHQGRRSSVIDDMGLSSRGERVIAEAIAERERGEERERLVKAGLQAEEEEAQRERLKRRFTVSGASAAGPSGRRNRVVYDDGTYKYAQ